MDLIGWGPNGRLDPFCACMLLWSGVISFEDGSIAWEGDEHRIQAPCIHRDVVSLHAVSEAEVEAVIPEVLQLLHLLDHDEELRVPEDSVADAVLEAIPTIRLTGLTLFLLQSGTHPLVIESVDARTICVRYDERLARGIPRLQELLCRMLQILWGQRGSKGAFSVQFVSLSATTGRTYGIEDFEGCVDGAVRRLDSFIELDGPIVQSVGEWDSGADGNAATDEAHALPEEDVRRRLRALSLMASRVLALEALRQAAAERVEDYDNTIAQLEVSKPDPHAKEYQAPSLSTLGIPTATSVMRTLVIRSIIYFAIGVMLILAGRELMDRGEHIVEQMTLAANHIVGIVQDAIGIALVQAQQIGSHNLIELPVEPIVSALRISGIVLISLGVVFPVLRILRLRRRLKREQRLGSSHASALVAMVEKSQQHAEASYAIDLDAWASNLAAAEDNKNLANTSLACIDSALRRLSTELERRCAAEGISEGMHDPVAVCTLADYVDLGKASTIDEACSLYRKDTARSAVGALPGQATDLQPTLRSADRAAHALARSIDAETTEERRYERVVEYCKGASSS